MSKLDASTKKKIYTHKGDKKLKQKYNTDLIFRPKENSSKLSHNTTPTAAQVAYTSHEKDNNQLRNKKNLRFSDKKAQQPTANGNDEPKTYFPQFGCEEYISRFDYLRNNLCFKTGIAKREVPKFQMKKVTLRNYTPKILNQEVNMGMWI